MPSSFAEFEPNLEPLGVLSGFVDEFIDAVQPHPQFAGFSRDETEVLAQYMQCYGVPSQSVVIREGDEGDFMAILVTGRAMVVKSFDGVDKIIQEIKTGEIVGEMSLIDGKPRFASCVAIEPSDFAVMTSDSLRALLAQHPDVGNKFLLMLLAMTTQRLRQTTALVQPELLASCF